MNTQLGGLLGAQHRCRLYSRTQELQRISEVLQRERASKCSLRGLIYVQHVLEHVRTDVQGLLDVVEALNQCGRQLRQLVRGNAQRLAVFVQKGGGLLRYLIVRSEQFSEPVGLLGQRSRDRGQVLVQLAQQTTAVMQRRDQSSQIFEAAVKVAAMVAERGNGLRQLDNGVPDICSLAAQVFSRGVDERPQRADPARLGGLQ